MSNFPNQYRADLHSQPLSLKKYSFPLFQIYDLIEPRFCCSTKCISPDRLEKILIKYPEFEKIESENEKSCEL